MNLEDWDDPAASSIEVRFWRGRLPNKTETHNSRAILRRKGKRWRTAHISRVVDPESTEIKKTTLHLYTWQGEPNADPNDLDGQEKERWHCDNEEILLLRAFLEENRPAGEYQLVSVQDASSGWGTIDASTIDSSTLRRLLEQLSSVPQLASHLALSNISSTVLQAAEIQRRRSDVARLRTLINEPEALESEIHEQLKGQAWIFGGQYVGEAVQKRLSTMSTLDIPLLRADGSLHVVELKRADVHPLVVKDREAGLVITSAVNRGVGQIQNYLRDLDEKRSLIQADYGIECRRSSGTLLIGNACRESSAVSRADVIETLRTYNSHQTRVEIMTYDDLLDNAERALNFEPPVA